MAEFSRDRPQRRRRHEGMGRRSRPWVSLRDTAGVIDRRLRGPLSGADFTSPSPVSNSTRSACARAQRAQIPQQYQGGRAATITSSRNAKQTNRNVMPPFHKKLNSLQF